MLRFQKVVNSFNNSTKKLIDKQNGLTLVELLIAIAVFSIVSVMIMAIFFSFQRGYTVQQVTTDVVQKARGALIFMSADIKMAGLDPKETKNFSIVTAESNLFTFEFDTPDPNANNEFDGVRLVQTDRPERRTYRFQNGRLEQIDNFLLVASPTVETLIPSIDQANCRFEYLRADRTVIPVPVASGSLTDIVFVRVVLTVREPSGMGSTVSRTMDSLVLCRNMQFNAQRL